LRRVQNHAGVNDDEFHNILKSHVLTPEYLYADDFYNFFYDRKEKILQRIEKAMNKPIPREDLPLEGVYVDDDNNEED